MVELLTRLDERQEEKKEGWVERISRELDLPELLVLVNQMQSWEDLLGDGDGLLARGDGRVEDIGNDFVVDGLVIDIRHHVHDDDDVL